MILFFIIVCLLVSVMFEGFGDYFVKLWSTDPSIYKNFILSLITYNCMLLTWMACIWKSKEISIVGTIWLLLGHGCLILVGAGMFHEVLTIKQWIGVGLAAVSLALMTL